VARTSVKRDQIECQKRPPNTDIPVPEVLAFVDAGACISYSAMTGMDLAVDGLDNFPDALSYAGVYTLVSGMPM